MTPFYSYMLSFEGIPYPSNDAIMRMLKVAGALTDDHSVPHTAHTCLLELAFMHLIVSQSKENINDSQLSFLPFLPLALHHIPLFGKLTQSDYHSADRE